MHVICALQSVAQQASDFMTCTGTHRQERENHKYLCCILLWILDNLATTLVYDSFTFPLYFSPSIELMRNLFSSKMTDSHFNLSNEVPHFSVNMDYVLILYTCTFSITKIYLYNHNSSYRLISKIFSMVYP